MEDSEYCTTELYLSSDGTVRLTGTTNGPLPSASTGQWTVTEEDGVFEMRVERKFRMGFGIGDGNGESFTVARVFRGEVDRVGGMIAVTGSMFIPVRFCLGSVFFLGGGGLETIPMSSLCLSRR